MTLPPGIYAQSRQVVTSQYSVMPPEGVLASRLPGFTDTTVRFLTSPEMGARFAQALLEIEPGGGTTTPRDEGLEHVFYLLSGEVTITIDDEDHQIEPHGYVYVPIGHPYAIKGGGDGQARLIWIKRPYEPIDLPAPDPVVGRRETAYRVENPDEPGRYWLRLLPVDDMAFDMEVNILGFEPGVYFPYVETHIMEHGLY
ncbi:MAG: cupin domain-containing protein, partial [Chloroflexota bacterium]